MSQQSEAMDIDPPKPPLIRAILEDEPLPNIPVGPRDEPKELHAASESAQHVALPRVILPLEPDYYSRVADDFLLSNSFDGLSDVEVGYADPSIIFHRNESDVGRSIDQNINRDVAMALVYGFTPARFTMDSTTQAWAKTTFEPRLPHDPEHITRIPDWTAKCQWHSPDQGLILSTLLLEYKDRELVFVDEFLAELDLTHERLVELFDYQQAQSRQLEAEIIAYNNGAPIAQGFNILGGGLLQLGLPNNRSTLGLKHPVPFTKNVTTTLHQMTTYAIGEGVSNLGIMDDDSLIMFRFRFDRTKDEITRFRVGPGPKVDVYIQKDQSEMTKRNVLGAWVRNIRGG